LTYIGGCSQPRLSAVQQVCSIIILSTVTVHHQRSVKYISWI